MSIPTVYRSSDTSAPQININTAGSFLAVVRACLVDGYGSKSPAGWTEEFTGTNIAAFKNSVADGGTGMLCRIDDTVTTAGNQRAITLDVYRTMSAIDAGTDKLTTRYGARRPANTNGTGVVDWACIATPTAAYFALWQTGITCSFQPIMGFGDVLSMVASDAFRYFCIGSNTSGEGNGGWMSGTTANQGANTSPTNGVSLGADHTGLNKDVRYGLWPTWERTAVGSDASPARPSVTGADEAVIPAYLARGNVLRARLPGMYIPVCSLEALSAGTILHDVVEPGSELIVLRGPGTASPGISSILVECAKDWGD